jgi:hypothetical protein
MEKFSKTIFSMEQFFTIMCSVEQLSIEKFLNGTVLNGILDIGDIQTD